MANWQGAAQAVLPAAGYAVGGPLGGAVGAGLASAFGGDRYESDTFYQQQHYLNEFAREQWDASSRFAAAEAAKDREMAREFAQMGVRWRVADAAAAGVHPLYALGHSGQSPAPAALGVGAPGAGVASGQDASRAGRAGVSAGERLAEIAGVLSLERAELENELLRSQLARENSAQLGPGVPLPSVSDNALIPGQGNAPVVAVQRVPLRAVASDPVKTHQEHGAITDSGWARTKDGWTKIPSQDVKERTEDNFLMELAWAVRNMLWDDPPPSGWKARGSTWERRWLTGEYVERPPRRKPVFIDNRYGPGRRSWREEGWR